MSELERALEAIQTSWHRWNSLRLEGHEWRHHATLSRAWERHIDELRKGGSASVESVAFKKAGDGGPIDESREKWRVWLAKPDKKRTQFRVGDEMVTAVFTGEHWWSLSGHAFRTNDGARSVSHGFGPAEGLVDPAPLLASLQMKFEGRATLLSRPSFLVSALPRRSERYRFDPSLPMLGAGADLYRLVVDSQTGVLLRSQAELDGYAFRIIEVDEIGVDETFSDGIFDPNRLRAGLTDL